MLSLLRLTTWSLVSQIIWMFFVASRELFLKQKKVESFTKPTHEDRMQLLNTNDGITLVTDRSHTNKILKHFSGEAPRIPLQKLFQTWRFWSNWPKCPWFWSCWSWGPYWRPGDNLSWQRRQGREDCGALPGTFRGERRRARLAGNGKIKKSKNK